MNRVRTITYSLLVASIVLCSSIAAGTLAQTQTPSPSPERKPSAQPSNPFAPESAPALPPGMTGSDSADPRAKLTPGMYDAGETAVGLKHITLLKKPDAFQLGTDDPDNPKVQKTLGLLGVSDTSKMPKRGPPLTRGRLKTVTADVKRWAARAVTSPSAPTTPSTSSTSAAARRRRSRCASPPTRA